MAVLSYDNDHTTAIPATTLFKAFVLEPETLLPKAAPQAIQSVETLEGDGGVGTVRKTTFVKGKWAKHKIEAIDKENLSYTYVMIEHDSSSASPIEKVVYETKFVPTADGGCLFKSKSTYHASGDINEDAIKGAREKAAGLFKAIEAYFIANPEA
jgi:hypothetical protein